MALFKGKGNNLQNSTAVFLELSHQINTIPNKNWAILGQKIYNACNKEFYKYKSLSIENYDIKEPIGSFQDICGMYVEAVMQKLFPLPLLKILQVKKRL